MAERAARPSTDQESAPLLSDPDEYPNGGSNPSLYQRVNSVAQEPLTPLTKILLILALFLLLTTSVFIGLFAGAQHRISLGGNKGGTTITVTTTATATTTQISTSQSISTATSTSTLTTTLAPPPPPPTPTTPAPPPSCLEPHCIVLSASILSSLDTTQDPCENFYDFANGGWLSKHPLPADKSSFGQFEALAQGNIRVIQSFLESKTKVGGVDDAILDKLRDFYSSCMDEKTLDEIGSTPLLHVVKTIRNLYRSEDTDISSASDKRVDGLTAAIAFLHSRGIGALFAFDVEGDVGVDPNHMVLWFNQPELTLPSKEYYEDEGVIALLRNVVEQLLLSVDQSDDLPNKLVDHNSPPALANNEDANVWPPWPWPPWGGDDDDDKPLNRTQRIHKLAKHVVEFERRLARASLDLDILYQDPIATYNPVQLSNLTSTLTQINFPTYFSTFTPRTFPDRVVLTYPSYSKSLHDILNDTDSDVIESYLVARAGFTLSPFLSMHTDAWKAQRALLEALTGIKKGAIGDRSEYCIERVQETLGFAAGRYFVNATFGGDSREKGTKVITDIVDAFKHSLKHIDWMDEKSARAAAEKADAIRIKVGYPLSPDTRNPTSIARYYSGVHSDKKDFFGNMLSSFASDTFKKWLQLGRSRDLDAWEMFPSTVNAYFNPPANEIVFPAGILQAPFFSQNWPGYLSYGAFGQVASHELTHAFDSAGRLYNQQGKLAQWWTNATSEGFKIKQKCIVDQYSSYYIDDGKGGKIYVNGNLYDTIADLDQNYDADSGNRTSGENIGDTGLIQAYRAWKSQYKDSERAGNEYLLPGLDFTREQLFFLSFARIWARAMKPAAAVQRIRTDPHSPSRFRVDGTVSNIPEFAKAFNCSNKAKLNPPKDKRCIFWGS
ncbi:hypothetical protein CVT24_010539 [Panaeolus cyanescens]|uniref:Endothelin-converting enzyme 1 n=1 Tax=Panaeolus cyanescens TaxID=181874 RepID=A0A409YYP4_9AGAR|nr:hypothetical protein CVT24_010539 [Panaeolus cyanescens]